MLGDLRPVYVGDASFLRSRDGSTCVSCDDRNKLTCPSCSTNQQCQFVYPTNCSVCPYATCVDKDVTSPPPSSSPDQLGQPSKPGVGPLAGGVIGGVAVIGLITYLVWRNCVKARRGTVEAESWVEEQPQKAAQEKDVAEHRSNPASVRTRNSIASTVLTRASNIIQIAYIPGVTNRATLSSPGSSGSPDVLVPPVPPIPARASRVGSHLVPEDKRFFVPGDLRNSTYSALSGFTDQTDCRRASFATRSSVASTIYPKKAVIVSAGQTGMRAKPAVVSVKPGNSGNSTGSNSPPPVPSVDFEKFGARVPRPASPANSMFSVGSTFLNSASAATPARAMLVRVGSVSKKSKASSDKASTVESTSPASRDSRAATLIEDAQDLGPFADPPETPSPKTVTNLSAVIEEATRRASARTSKAIPLPGATRGKSPFGDEHATK